MASVRIEPYSAAELGRLMDPASIAIVGASPREGSFGQRVQSNLHAFEGRIYPVNGRYPEIGGLKSYSSLADLPEAPDCVVVALARDNVEATIRDAARVGAGGAVIFASAFAETGKPEDVAAQQRLVSIAAESGLKIVGPNCLGLLNVVSGAQMTFQTPPERTPARPFSIGLISQSGALGVALSQAAVRGVCFSHILTSGNSCDVDVADFISFLADDPSCGAIACAFEGVAQPARLLSAARRAWEADKPLVVYKMATSDSGAAAAMSHSGTFAGSHAAYCAALRREGAIVVDTLEALIEVASFFGKASAPLARGAAVLATSGGASIMAADAAFAADVPLPPLGANAHEVLSARVPDFGTVANPCDVTAQIVNDPQMFADCADALFADPAFGVLVTPHVLAQDFAVPRIATLDTLAREHGKIACNVWVSQWLEGPGVRECETAGNVALFHSMERCFWTLSEWQRRADLRARPRERERVSAVSARAEARNMLLAAGPVLTERQSKAVLAAYGIPVALDHTVGSATEAVASARSIGGPVVMKGEAASIPHKSEAGLVKLNLKTEADISTAYEAIVGQLDRLARDEKTAVVVQPMIPPGIELMIGGRIDPQFGPLVVVGLGGVLVEALRDTALAPAPVSREDAHSMLASLRSASLLDGFRHFAPVDRDRLADIVRRFSEFLHDQADMLSEVDVNPLICSGDRIVAVDGLITKAEPASAVAAG
jgi:acyl-CoA synthetase (NDP forming)